MCQSHRLSDYEKKFLNVNASHLSKILYKAYLSLTKAEQILSFKQLTLSKVSLFVAVSNKCITSHTHSSPLIDKS